MAQQMSVNVGGSWHKVKQPYVNVGGSWKKVKKVWVNVSGTWKQVWVGHDWSSIGSTKVYYEDVFYGYSDNPPVPDNGSHPSPPRITMDGIDYEVAQILYDTHRTGSKLYRASSIKLGNLGNDTRHAKEIEIEWWFGGGTHSTMRMTWNSNFSGSGINTYFATNSRDYTRFSAFTSHVGSQLNFRIKAVSDIVTG